MVLVVRELRPRCSSVRHVDRARLGSLPGRVRRLSVIEVFSAVPPVQRLSDHKLSGVRIGAHVQPMIDLAPVVYALCNGRPRSPLSTQPITISTPVSLRLPSRRSGIPSQSSPQNRLTRFCENDRFIQSDFGSTERLSHTANPKHECELNQQHETERDTSKC
jgi:hypothetical protein